jgi:cellulose synthase/poly-beta-1,6-N-acetylglucosamine synthase-like glycosyltransferase
LHGILPSQYAAAGLLGLALVAGAILAPMSTLMVVTGAMIAVLLCLVIFRLACMCAGMSREKLEIDDATLAALRDEDLPSYTVMVPMLHERESTLRGLVRTLNRLDYPTDRLQIQLILEETDVETRAVIEDMLLPEHFDIVLIPEATPKTKGKACNYALYFARGERFTIYDAEDHPDPLQLKKAVAAFAASPEDVVCAQSCLNFYNVRENWLTRMFTLDYTVWYDLMLPGLERLGVPICLGGTSNHFLTQVVRDLDGWDAYNVTEDADMGLRLAKKGMRTIMLDSTTLEEANTRIGNWVRQRSRWMKGYMMTYLVHMRAPIAFLIALGPWRFAGVQLFVAGNFVGNLINPPLWGITLLWASNELWEWSAAPLFHESFWYPAMFTLVVGNLSALGFTVLAAYRRRMYDLIPYVLTLPAYWALAAIASYKALYQLFTRPFYWEKTEHGLTQLALPEAAT